MMRAARRSTVSDRRSRRRGAAGQSRLHQAHRRGTAHGDPEIRPHGGRLRRRLAGPRLFISGEASNARTHLMRAHHDVIMVGVGTVLADDPLLTCRLPGLEHRSPVRVVLDTACACRRRQLMATARGGADLDRRRARRAGRAEAALVAAGAEVMRVRGAGRPRRPARRARGPRHAGRHARVFSEGGPSLGDALAEAELVDALRAPHRARRSVRRACRPSARASGGVSSTFSPSGAEEPPARRDRLRYFEEPLMFTGIVTDVGESSPSRTTRAPLKRLRIHPPTIAATIPLGASIACGGPCLTVVGVGPRPEGGCWFTVDAAAETLARTTVGDMGAGGGSTWSARSRSATNSAATRLRPRRRPRHDRRPRGRSQPRADDPWGPTARFDIRAPAAPARFIAAKGSVCLDGTSLTVNTVETTLLRPDLPHTLAVTTWGGARRATRSTSKSTSWPATPPGSRRLAR